MHITPDPPQPGQGVNVFISGYLSMFLFTLILIHLLHNATLIYIIHFIWIDSYSFFFFLNRPTTDWRSISNISISFNLHFYGNITIWLCLSNGDLPRQSWLSCPSPSSHCHSYLCSQSMFPFIKRMKDKDEEKNETKNEEKNEGKRMKRSEMKIKRSE